jgi:hypothetical protein
MAHIFTPGREDSVPPESSNRLPEMNMFTSKELFLIAAEE